MSQQPAPHRGPLLFIWLAVVVASGAAAYLLYSFMQKTYGLEAFDSACNINETFNCDKINTSTWGKIAGFPITLFALATYAAWAALAWLGSATDDRARVCMRLLQVSSALAVCYGLFLVYVMVSIEQTFCLFCLTMDLAAVTTLVASTLGLKRLGPAEGSLYWGRPVVTAVVVGALSLGMSLTWHQDEKSKLLSAQQAKADAIRAEADKARAELAKQAASAKQPSSAGAAATARPQEAKKLSNSLYVVPVHADNPTLGPADAKVTVVEYADFQCGYCKKLFYALQTVKTRYKDKVRFVFKHFPMSTRCNPHLKNNKHRYACGAALSAECARQQGKFWEMHDVLFKNQHKLTGRDLRWYAERVGLDMGRFEQCMRAPEPRQALKRDIDEAALKLEIRATPRTFINGLLLSGSLPPEVLGRFIDEELKKAGSSAPAQPAAPQGTDKPLAAATDGGMVRIAAGSGAFFIDAYEAAIDANGAAISRKGVQPASASWFQAKAACEKAGKRLCTSFEWVTACQGKDAVDDDNNGNFADDYIEGNQFPYADFFEPNRCHVNGDRRDGTPVKTGSKEGCRTPSGVFDLAGNVEEWIELDEQRAQLAGGDYRVKEKGSCLRAHRSFGPGHRNRGIGFRCCADTDVKSRSAKVADGPASKSLIGAKVRPFSVDILNLGVPSKTAKATTADLKGKVTFVTFFASWCSPCSREIPELASLIQKYGKRGFQVLAVGVDTERASSENFVRKVGNQVPGLRFAADPSARMLGQFDVTNMPTGYLVDRGGVIRHRQVGFGDKTVGELMSAIEKLL